MKRAAYFNQFKKNTIILLFMCGAVSVLLRDIIGTFMIAVIIILNTLMEFAREIDPDCETTSPGCMGEQWSEVTLAKRSETTSPGGNLIEQVFIKIEKYILYIAAVICGFITLLAIIRKEELFTIFNLNTNFILALIPAGLPLAVTVTQTLGTRTIANHNLKRLLKYFLSCNTAIVLLMLTAALFSLPMPLEAVHILWINLIINSFPAITFNFDIKEKDSAVFKRVPEEIIARGTVVGISAFIIFASIYSTGNDLLRARTSVFVFLAFSQLLYIFEFKFKKYDFLIIGMVFLTGILMLFIIYIPAMQAMFKTNFLQKQDWLILSGFILLNPILNNCNKIVKILLKKDGGN